MALVDVLARGGKSSVPKCDSKVFIGHGRSHVWLPLKDFLTGRLGRRTTTGFPWLSITRPMSARSQGPPMKLVWLRPEAMHGRTKGTHFMRSEDHNAHQVLHFVRPICIILLIDRINE
jgi:hypothetical protein